MRGLGIQEVVVAAVALSVVSGCRGDGNRAERNKPPRTEQPRVRIDGGSAIPEPSLATDTPATDVLAISVGDSHACSLWDDGLVRCWGVDHRLGDGSLAYRPVPTKPVKGVADVVAIAASPSTSDSCAVQKDATVKCWGQSRSARPIAGLENVTAVTVGYQHSCALLRAGTVVCWGQNNSGQLGNGSKKRADRPVPVKGLTDVAQIVAGGEHTCAVQHSGKVWCWGNGWSGAVGNGLNVYETTPVELGLSNVVNIAAAFDHTCAVRKGGTVWCWGDNGSGQLGNGSRKTRGTPVRVASIDSAVAVALGISHSCARLSTGALRCWGGNYVGQLGDRTISERTKPAAVRGYLGKWKDRSVVTVSKRKASQISSGPRATCALSQAGDVACWGDGRILPRLVIPEKASRNAVRTQ